METKQAQTVNALIAEGFDFLRTEPNAAPSNPPTIVMQRIVTQGWELDRIVRVYWDGQTTEAH
jgi:hypothetical protein